ncbi:MAG: DUF3391 domain-containing protein, partial [Betaproteobacteria bacterium]
MTQKVNAQDIKIGMFVADLDRPWIDTPFLLQGFLIEDEEQLRQLHEHCAWVLIDPQRSVGPDFNAPVKRAIIAPRDLGTEPRVTVTRTAAPSISGPAAKESVAGAARATAPGAAPRSRPDGGRSRSREF